MDSTPVQTTSSPVAAASSNQTASSENEALMIPTLAPSTKDTRPISTKLQQRQQEAIQRDLKSTDAKLNEEPKFTPEWFQLKEKQNDLSMKLDTTSNSSAVAIPPTVEQQHNDQHNDQHDVEDQKRAPSDMNEEDNEIVATSTSNGEAQDDTAIKEEDTVAGEFGTPLLTALDDSTGSPVPAPIEDKATCIDSFEENTLSQTGDCPDEEGSGQPIAHISPYSFCIDVARGSRPMLAFAACPRSDEFDNSDDKKCDSKSEQQQSTNNKKNDSNGWKDAQRDAELTGVFCVNLVSEEMAWAMNASAAPLGKGLSEFQLMKSDDDIQLEHQQKRQEGSTAATNRVIPTPVPAPHIRAPYVAESPMFMECRYVKTVKIPDIHDNDSMYSLIIGEVVNTHVRNDVATTKHTADDGRDEIIFSSHVILNWTLILDRGLVYALKNEF